MLDSVNPLNSAFGKNSDASLYPSSTPKSVDYGSVSMPDSSHTMEDRNQGQTSKSNATVRGPVGSADPQTANSSRKNVYPVACYQADVVKVADCKRFAEIDSNPFLSPKGNPLLVQK